MPLPETREIAFGPVVPAWQMSQTVQQADNTETRLGNTGENMPPCEFIDPDVEITILMCCVVC